MPPILLLFSLVLSHRLHLPALLLPLLSRSSSSRVMVRGQLVLHPRVSRLAHLHRTLVSVNDWLLSVHRLAVVLLVVLALVVLVVVHHCCLPPLRLASVGED